MPKYPVLTDSDKRESIKNMRSFVKAFTTAETMTAATHDKTSNSPAAKTGAGSFLPEAR